MKLERGERCGSYPPSWQPPWVGCSRTLLTRRRTIDVYPKLRHHERHAMRHQAGDKATSPESRSSFAAQTDCFVPPAPKVSAGTEYLFRHPLRLLSLRLRRLPMWFHVMGIGSGVGACVSAVPIVWLFTGPYVPLLGATRREAAANTAERRVHPER